MPVRRALRRLFRLTASASGRCKDGAPPGGFQAVPRILLFQSYHDSYTITAKLDDDMFRHCPARVSTRRYTN